jgi:hypothetical protein
MADVREEVPVVELPERIDRRLGLGPFPSARDALKFVCYAAAGAVLAPWLTLPVGLGIAALGFLLSTWRPDGRAWDERAVAAVRWKWRSGRSGVAMTARPGSPLLRRGFVRLADGELAAVVQTAGTPMAYLPPAELARKFGEFRDLLRSTDGRLALLSTLVTIHGSPFLPPREGPSGPGDAARAGYAELVELLCRRRSSRRVYVALGSAGAGPDAAAALEGRVASLIDRLAAFGLRPARLKDAALLEAARRFGWTATEAGT